MSDAASKPLFSRNVPGSTQVLQKACVAVAGCGGLGSNAAVALVRAGVGELILADFDVVEETNLNRQYFFRSDLRQPKVIALADHLRNINPDVRITSHHVRVTTDKVVSLFGRASLLIEAFDQADQKKMLIESWCVAFPAKPVIAGNGMSGQGRLADLTLKHTANIYFCGDGKTEMSMGLSAPRVAVVANMQASVAIDLLLGKQP